MPCDCTASPDPRQCHAVDQLDPRTQCDHDGASSRASIASEIARAAVTTRSAVCAITFRSPSANRATSAQLVEPVAGTDHEVFCDGRAVRACGEVGDVAFQPGQGPDVPAGRRSLDSHAGARHEPGGGVRLLVRGAHRRTPLCSRAVPSLGRCTLPSTSWPPTRSPAPRL
jgi:hypothetical protein